MGDSILKISGIFLFLAGIILIVSFIIELLNGTFLISQGMALSSSELYSSVFALSEKYPELVVEYTLEVFALLICIPGLVGIAVFLGPKSRRKWTTTLLLSVLGIAIILYAFPILLNGLLTAYHLTGSPPPAAIPGISHSAWGDIHIFIVFGSIGVALLIGGGGGTVARLSRDTNIPRQVRILGLLTAALGILSIGNFLLMAQLLVFIIIYKAAIVLFSVWLLLMGWLILRIDMPSLEISRISRILMLFTGIIGIAINVAEFILMPMVTEPSSIDNLLAQLQSGGSIGPIFAIVSLVVALLLIPSFYTIHKQLAMEQNAMTRFSMILIVISSILFACASILQFPVYSWAEWYPIIIDSSIYDQFLVSAGMIVTIMRVLFVVSVLVFSLGLLLLAYQFVKAGNMGLRGVIVSAFALLGLALTGIISMESLIAFPTTFVVISQIVLYSFVFIAGGLFIKPESHGLPIVEDTSSDD